MSLSGKRIVIVGGSSGIGYAVAEAALAAGAEVVVASSQRERVEAAAARLGERASGVTMDVRSEPDVAQAVEGIGALDHLVFTAGDWGAIRGAQALADLDIAAASAVFAVRFWGALTVVKHAHKLMPPQGSITLTDGMVAHRPRRGGPLSSGMAGAVEHLAQGLAVDLAPIRVNAVCPGLVRTAIWDGVPEERRAEQFKTMTGRQPLARPGEPAEVAEAYLYLMRGGYTTGQVLHVDGGMSIV